MQGTRVQALVQEDPTCSRATKPMRHNSGFHIVDKSDGKDVVPSPAAGVSPEANTNLGREVMEWRDAFHMLVILLF